MKKHPIDELFAKKLAEHRQEPSQKAFEKFQARLQEKQTKRRGGIFIINRNWGYYAAAASIVAALTIGILSQKNTVDTEVLAHITPKKIEKKAIEKVNVENSQNALAQKESVLPATASKETSEKIIKVLPITTHETSVAKVKQPTRTLEEKIIDDSPLEENAVALNTLPDNTGTIQTEEVVSLEENKNTIASEEVKQEIGESIVLIYEPEEEKEMIPSINEDSPTSLAEAKQLSEEKSEKERSFLAKLYGEYKHFKYGEKVDLKRIGVKDALARVDESLFKEERDDVRGFVQRKIGRIQKRE